MFPFEFDVEHNFHIEAKFSYFLLFFKDSLQVY